MRSSTSDLKILHAVLFIPRKIYKFHDRSFSTAVLEHLSWLRSTNAQFFLRLLPHNDFWLNWNLQKLHTSITTITCTRFAQRFPELPFPALNKIFSFWSQSFSGEIYHILQLKASETAGGEPVGDPSSPEQSIGGSVLHDFGINSLSSTQGPCRRVLTTLTSSTLILLTSLSQILLRDWCFQ